MMSEPTQPRVIDNSGEQRYEAFSGDELAGFAAYQKADNLIVFTHTEVDPAFEGKGVGSVLVRQALDDVRRQGLPVLPMCPFVRQWMKRHPDYHDLVYRRPVSHVSS